MQKIFTCKMYDGLRRKRNIKKEQEEKNEVSILINSIIEKKES